MAGTYAYTPEICLPLAAAILVAAVALYCWRHRHVPGALPLSFCALYSSLWLLGNALAAAAVAPATILAWHRFQAVCQLPAVTAGTGFALEYAYPGRWLTRRNVALLALPPLLFLLMVVVNDGQFAWRRLEIAADGSVLREFTPLGLLIVAYALGLVLVNAAALLWLFARSPQHRWPVALILFGQTANRGLYLFGVLARRSQSLLGLDVVAVILPWIAMCAIALFGFRIFDPRPAARAAALEQMRDGMVVLDSQWRVMSLNRAAAGLLGPGVAGAPGRALAELAPAFRDLPGRLADAEGPFFATEITLETGDGLRHCAADLSLLRDPRGLPVGHLLMLRDLTEQRRAEAQLREKQRTLGVLQERERLAHELHDSLGQALAAAHLQASSARMLLARGQATQVDKCLAGMADATQQAEADVREYLLSAQTALSAERLFFPALREYLRRFTRQYGLPVELTVPALLEAQGLPEAVEVQLLRIIQEALSNVRKHARARRAQVIFTPDGSQARVAIVDDGQGFDPAATAARGERYGLQAMAERAESAGGSLTVISGPGQGTQVVARVPLASGERWAIAAAREEEPRHA